MNKKNRKLVIASMLGAITIVLGLTPLGFIPLGVINATTMHIPVIVGAIVEGPVVGALVGLIFGLSSIFNAITRPTPISPVFYNPLISVVPRVIIGLVTYYIYRIFKDKNPKALKTGSLITYAVTTLFLLNLLYKNIKSAASPVVIGLNVLFLLLSIGMLYFSVKNDYGNFDVVAAAFLGSMTNTVLVLGGIYIIYAEKYMQIIGVESIDAARAAIAGVAITSGIPEAIFSVIITTSVVKALKYKRG